MAKSLQLSRNEQARRDRQAKTMLLPMPRLAADDLALQCHLALDLLRRGWGSEPDAKILTKALVLTYFVGEMGYRRVSDEQVRLADAAIMSCVRSEHPTGKWVLDEQEFDVCAVIVSAYDYLLHKVPLGVVNKATSTIKRYQPSSVAS